MTKQVSGNKLNRICRCITKKPIELAGSFRRHKRAVSSVVSNMILIAAVIVVGFAVLTYAQTNSTNYEAQYSQNIDDSIDKLKETICFEYVQYNSVTKNVSIYLMNSGDVDVTIQSVQLSTSSESMTFSMYYKNGQISSNHRLDSGQEGYLIVPTDLNSGIYQIILTTERESTFAYDFGA